MTPQNSKGDLVSVIVPVYNAERYVIECLNSLIEQTYDDFEIIVINDGSTDRSVECIEDRFGNEPRLKIFNLENGGAGLARNKGVEHSAGDFIVFVDDDDFVSPDFLATLLAAQKVGDHDIVSGQSAKVAGGGEVLREPIPSTPKQARLLSYYEKVLGAFEPSVPWARLIRQELLKNGDLRFRRSEHEDLFFTYKLIRSCRSHGRVEKTIYFWRQLEGSRGKRAEQGHVIAAFALIDDTNEFLRSVGGTELEYALAARRNIVFLEHIMKYAKKAKGEVWLLFQETLQRNQEQVGQQFETFYCSKINKTPIPSELWQLVNELGYQPTVRAQMKRFSGRLSVRFGWPV